MPRIQVDSRMQADIKGSYAVGDGAGLTQGIVQAAATGLLAAQDIVAKTDTRWRFGNTSLCA